MTPEFKPSLLIQRNKNKSSRQLDLEKWGITSNLNCEAKDNDNFKNANGTQTVNKVSLYNEVF